MTTPLGFATGLRDSAQQAADYWRDLYAKFNPNPSTVQTPNISPIYQQGAASLNSANAADLGKGGPTGSNFDPTAFQTRLGRQSGLQEMEQQHGMDMGNKMRNLGAYQENAMGGMNRMEQVGRGDQEREQAQQFGELGRYITQDDIQRMWDEYNYGKPSPFSEAAGAAGGVLGQEAGNAFGKSLFSPNQDEQAISAMSLKANGWY